MIAGDPIDAGDDAGRRSRAAAIEDPDRVLFLAVPKLVFEGLFTEPIGRLVIQKGKTRLISFDPESEEIVEWLR